MEYRAVANRCAVNLKSLGLPISDEQAISILRRKKFRMVEVDLIQLARQCIGTSLYRRGASPHYAPQLVDCSSFVKWLYGQRGIWLPRRSIQQRELGEVVLQEEIFPGDLVFVSGLIDYYHNDPKDGVGHVGIATENSTIIHAANSQVHVTETPLKEFLGKNKFRGIRRYIPKDLEVLTFETPPECSVETTSDFRWIILQSLP